MSECWLGARRPRFFEIVLDSVSCAVVRFPGGLECSTLLGGTFRVSETWGYNHL